MVDEQQSGGFTVDRLANDVYLSLWQDEHLEAISKVGPENLQGMCFLKIMISLVLHFCSSDLFNSVLCQMISRTNSKSKMKGFNVLAKMLTSKEDCNEILANFCIHMASGFNQIVVTDTMCRVFLLYSKFFFNINWNTLDENTKQKLVVAHSSLCSFFAKSRSKKFYYKNSKHLGAFLRSLSKEDLKSYYELVKSQFSVASNEIGLMVLWNLLIDHDQASGNGLMNQFHQFTLESFIKAIVQSKTKIIQVYQPFAFEQIVSRFQMEDFKNQLLPALQKALLRNAEVSVSLLVFLDFLQFDLNDVLKGKDYSIVDLCIIGIFFEHRLDQSS